MGITGVMKIAHFAEALGVDVEIHLCGPAARHAMSAMRNSNYYEMALVGPGMDNIFPPPYAGDYSDQLDSIDSDGCVAVPGGPGLGVTYDWEYIDTKRIKVHEFRGE
jgi:L-alanine-DL-glutamate epimerase-like enolase superfamily enzyme